MRVEVPSNVDIWSSGTLQCATTHNGRYLPTLEGTSGTLQVCRYCRSLNTLLKIFKKSSIVNLTTEALKPLLLVINHYRSRRLYFRDYLCRLRSRFKALRSRFRDFVIKYIIENL